MPKSALHLLSALQVERTSMIDTSQMISDGGGLYLFVRDYGRREWIFRYTSPLTGQRRKQTLGTYPDTTLKEARRLASQKREMLSLGKDPLSEADKQREKEKQALLERQQRQQNTVCSVFELWKRFELQNRKDEGNEIKRAFEKDVFPIIGSKPIGEVSRQDVKTILDRPLRRGVKRMANRLLSDLKQFFRYAQDEELLPLDPTRRLLKERVGGKENMRQRYLSLPELRLLSDLLPHSGLGQASQSLIWLLLATGCRVNEILRARWEHIDWKKRLLHIPKEHSKNTIAHEIYLSDFALKHLTALKKTQTTAWLVPNRKGDGPVTRQVLTKQVTDRQQPPSSKNRLTNSQTLILPGGYWVIHDLRRTTATLMQEAGVLPYIVKKCLNQKTEDKIMETYQRASLAVQQRQAFEGLGKQLASMENKKRINLILEQ